MSELLLSLPKRHPLRARILEGYNKMMASLLKYQGEDGLWHQLIDHPESWAETSGTGMFTFAMITGVRNGWLPAKEYGPAARKAWLVTMTNPKSLAYYGSVFAVLLPVHAPVWVYAAAVGITSLISCIWYCGVAWLLSGEAPRRVFLKARPAMERVSGLFLVGLGIRMLTVR